MKSFVTLFLTGIGLLCVLNRPAKPQSVTCRANVDRMSIEAGETVNYTVEISGTDAQSAGRPVLPAMKGLELLSPNPGESTSVQIINGVRSESKSYHYLLRGTAKGPHRIEPAEVRYKNRIIRSNTVFVSVGEAEKGKVAKSEDDVFFRAEVSRKELYVGEQLIVSFRLYSRFSTNNYNIVRLPNTIGFWAEELPVTERTAGKNKIGKQTYRVEVIRRMAVFPAYAGELVIDAAEMDCEINIPRNRNDVFSDPLLSFFPDPFGQTVVRRLATLPVTVKVEELPKTGQPVDFNGLVGQFDIDMRLDKTKLKTGEPVTARVTFSGTGNIMSADAAHSPFPAEYDIFSPVIRYNIQRDPLIIKGQKTFEWMAIPKTRGEYAIAPYSFSYYDPAVKKYVSKQSAGFAIRVEQGATVQNDTAVFTEKPILLAGLKTEADKPGPAERLLFNVWTFWISFLAPPAVLGAMLAWRRLRPEMQTRKSKRYVKNISKISLKNLLVLTGRLESMKKEDVYAELKKILLNFISVRYAISPAYAERQTIDVKMCQAGADSKNADLARNLLSRCDEMRYAPESGHAETSADIESCISLIRGWDKK